jgi:hypothetical protein
VARLPIIGLIGGDEQPTEASMCGAWIARSGYILLTGGRPIEDKQVKNAAMSGAVSLDGDGPVARLIGVLPSHSIKWNRPSRLRLYLETGLGSLERDPINGMTPDVLVVFRGGTGTLCELAYAAVSGKPILFIDSVRALREKAGEHRRDGKLERAFTTALSKYSTVRGRMIDPKALHARLDRALADGSDMPGRDFSILSRTISLLNNDLAASEFPGIPENDRGTTNQFESIVSQISA